MREFRFDGRVNRSKNFEMQIFCLVMNAAILVIIFHFFKKLPIISFAIFPAFLCISWIGFASYIKRAHDIGRSGWFAMTPFLAQFLIFPIMRIANLPPDGGVAAVLVMAFLAYFLAVVLWVTFKPGDPNANRYGGPPSS